MTTKRTTITPAAIRYTRVHELCMTQAELADACHVARVTVSRWENARQAIPHWMDMYLKELTRPHKSV